MVGGRGSIQIGYLVPQRQTYENWIHKQSNAPDGVSTVLSAHSDLIAAVLKLIVVSLSERDKHTCVYTYVTMCQLHVRPGVIRTNPIQQCIISTCTSK